MEVLLDNQLALYKNKRQVENGQMSPATLRGYAKSLTGGRMRRLHGVKVADVIPSAVRDWISDMDCTSKAICNMLSPIRSVIEDALNDGVIEFNPFDMDRTRKVN